MKRLGERRGVGRRIVVLAVLLACGACGSQPGEPGFELGGSHVDHFLHYDRGEMSPRQVCESLKAMDPEWLASEGLHPAAIFDLDNTVWAGQAIDPLLASLIELELIPASSNPILKGVLRGVDGVDLEAVESNSVSENAVLFLERSGSSNLPKKERIGRKDQFYGVAAIMAGMSPDEANRAATHFFYVGTSRYPAWESQIFSSEDGCGMTEIMAELRKKSVDVYLVSASLEPIVKVAGNFLGVDASRRRGSAMRVENGVYTGEVESLYSVKGAAVREWLGRPAILAFGDSAASDFQFMADVAGPVFMINPSDEFLAKEEEHVGGRFVTLRFSDTVQSLDSEGASVRMGILEPSEARASKSR